MAIFACRTHVIMALVAGIVAMLEVAIVILILRL